MINEYDDWDWWWLKLMITMIDNWTSHRCLYYETMMDSHDRRNYKQNDYSMKVSGYCLFIQTRSLSSLWTKDEKKKKMTRLHCCTHDLLRSQTWHKLPLLVAGCKAINFAKYFKTPICYCSEEKKIISSPSEGKKQSLTR